MYIDIVTCQAHPVLVKSGSNVFLKDPWPRVLSLPEAQVGLLETPPHWHATIYIYENVQKCTEGMYRKGHVGSNGYFWQLAKSRRTIGGNFRKDCRNWQGARVQRRRECQLTSSLQRNPLSLGLQSFVAYQCGTSAPLLLQRLTIGQYWPPITKAI